MNGLPKNYVGKLNCSLLAGAGPQIEVKSTQWIPGAPPSLGNVIALRSCAPFRTLWGSSAARRLPLPSGAVSRWDV